MLLEQQESPLYIQPTNSDACKTIHIPAAPGFSGDADTERTSRSLSTGQDPCHWAQSCHPRPAAVGPQHNYTFSRQEKQNKCLSPQSGSENSHTAH